MGAGDPIFAADYAGIRRGTIDMPVCSMVATGTIALASGGTPITFAGEDFDPYGFHSTVSNTSRITPTFAGYYFVNGEAYFAGNTNQNAAWVRKNGATAIPSGNRQSTPGVAGTRSNPVHRLIFFNGTTDYVELIGDPQGAVNTAQSIQFSSYFEVFYTGRILP